LETKKAGIERKRRMKNFRWLALLLTLLMVAMMVSACGGGKTAGENEPANRLEAIKARGYIQVATEPYFAPYEFIDPAQSGSDQYVGADIELAKFIAEKLEVECRIVPLEFPAVLASIVEGKYDLAISGLAFTPARAESMILSKGYFFDENAPGHGLLIREELADKIKSADDLADYVVVCQSGSLQELYATTQIPACKELKRVSATTDGFLLVQEGKADACVTSIPTGQLYIEANEGCGLIIVEGFEFETDPDTLGTRIGIPPGETELADFVNDIITEVLELGLFEKWYEEYTDYARTLGI